MQIRSILSHFQRHRILCVEANSGNERLCKRFIHLKKKIINYQLITSVIEYFTRNTRSVRQKKKLKTKNKINNVFLSKLWSVEALA